MADNNLLPTEKARLVHMDAIAHHENEIIRHKHELNKLAPISRLPPEVLGTIFACIARDRSAGKFSLYRWFWFSHTCFEWRQVALNTPRIWGHVHLTKNLELLCELFTRSKQAPLHISSLSPIYDKDILKMVFEQIHRVHTLHLWLSPGFSREGLPSPLSAPELRRFELYGGAGPRANIIFREECTMPKLSYLELRSHITGMSWSHPILRNSLTHLGFHGIIPDTDTWNTVLTALASMTSLKTLDLQHAALPASSCPDISPIVELPKLESLRITDNAMGCISFLQHTIFPGTALLSLNVTMVDDDDIALVSAAVGAKLRNVASVDTNVHSMYLDNRTPLWRVLAWTRDFGTVELMKAVNEEDHPTNSDLRLDLTIQPVHSIASFSQFSSVYNPLPTSTIHTLYVKMEQISAPHYQELSTALFNVRDLVIDPQDYSSWAIPLFIDVLPPTAGTVPKEMLFPNLKVLMLVDVKFRRSGGTGDDQLLQAFQQRLKERMDAGRAIEELILEDAVNIGKDDVERLSGVVGKVTWDPASVSWESDEEEGEDGLV